MKAAEAGKTKIVEWLLTHGADSNKTNEVAPVRTALKFECCMFYCPSAVVTYAVWHYLASDVCSNQFIFRAVCL